LPRPHPQSPLKRRKKGGANSLPTQTASRADEGLLGCEEKGRSQTQIEGSEQTQEEGQSRVTVITAEFEV